MNLQQQQQQPRRIRIMLPILLLYSLILCCCCCNAFVVQSKTIHQNHHEKATFTDKKWNNNRQQEQQQRRRQQRHIGSGSGDLSTTQTTTTTCLAAMMMIPPDSILGDHDHSHSIITTAVQIQDLVTNWKDTTLLSTLTSFRDSAMHIANAIEAPPFVTNHIVQPFSNILTKYQELLSTYPIRTKSITAGILGCTGDAIAQYKSYDKESKQHQQLQQAENDDNNNIENDTASLSSLSTSLSNFQYDWKRGLAFLMFGMVYTGCFQHFWFTTLNNNIQDWGEDFHIWGHPAERNINMDWFLSDTSTSKEPWWEFFDVVAQIDDVMAGLPDPPSSLTLAAAKVALNQFLVIPTIYMPLFFALTGAVAGMDLSKSIARAQSLYIPLLQRNYLYWLPMQFIQFLVLPNEWQIPFLCVASLCWTIILSSIGGTTKPTSTNIAYETTTTMAANPSKEALEMPLMGGGGSVSKSIYDNATTTTSNSRTIESIVDVSNGNISSPMKETNVEFVKDDIFNQQQQQGQEQEEDELVIRVIPNDSGPINEMTDGVRFEDVRKVFVPDEVIEVASDPKVQSVVGGLTLGIIAAAADDAAIGVAIGNIIVGMGSNALLGAGVSASVSVDAAAAAATPGIALTSAAGAAVAYLVAQNNEENQNNDNDGDNELDNDNDNGNDDDDDDDDQIANDNKKSNQQASDDVLDEMMKISSFSVAQAKVEEKSYLSSGNITEMIII